MNEKDMRYLEETEIDMRRLIEAVFRKAWLIAAAAVAGAVVTFLVTFFFITPQYQATAKFYVNNSALSQGGASEGLTSGDLTTSRNLVDSYIVILKTRETLNDVMDYAGVNHSCETLQGMIEASAVDNTEIFQVTVTSEDPREAERIANAIVCILPKRISAIVEGTCAKVVETAVIPGRPSSPSYVKNTLAGFLLGFALTMGGIVVREVFDTTIRTVEDISRSCTYPVLTTVPDMLSQRKDSRYYGYGEQPAPPREPAVLGGNISFAASEAYKLLRTKLQFSFADEKTSRVIGISSALSGEGKSLSAVNLAYALSELGMRVMLLECDMRRPTLAQKLDIKRSPGLSNYLTRQSNLVSLVQPCGLKEDQNAFHVIASGPNPPNPIELLSSARMSSALRSLRKIYDYVILDLPPVSEVSDAMSIADQTDGTLLVVRQNCCSRNALEDTVRQFEFVNARILGVVFNGTGGGGRGKRRGKTNYENPRKTASRGRKAGVFCNK